MRFSVWPTNDRPWAEVLEVARWADETGWHGLWYADHYMPNTDDGSVAGGPALECWSVLGAVAATTTNLRIGPYLVEDETIEEVEKDVFIPFIHRPLSRYVNALAANGLLIERMEEPAPPPGFLTRATEYEAAATIPRLLYLRCRKTG